MSISTATICPYTVTVMHPLHLIHLLVEEKIHCVSMGERNSYLHAKSAKQKIATTSSTEAEVVALVEAMKMCQWLRKVLTELGVSQLNPIIVHEDNKSCILMDNQSNAPNNNSRHFIARVEYLHSLALAVILLVLYLATAAMTADVRTKPQHGIQKRNKSVSVLRGCVDNR